MARRVIATAEVQVAADVGMAEAGLEGLVESFRSIGQVAARAAEKTEAAFMSATGNIQGGYQIMLRESNKMLASMASTDAQAESMAATFREALAAIRRMSAEDGYEQKAVAALAVYRQIAATLGVVEEGLHTADGRAEALLRSSQEIEGAIRAAEIRTDMLGRAFRDVGQDIEIAMAGGFDEVQDEIRRTIRRVEDLGGEFRDVGRIARTALNDIGAEAAADLDRASNAALRLARQLADVENGELRRVEEQARDAARALNATARAAKRADRSIDGIGNVSRRVSGDVRGLIGLLGAAGLGYAAVSVTKFGLDMTQQLEKSEAAFLGLTGSVEGAADMLERMVIFARETPYNLANVTEAAAQLLAVGDGFGVTTQNIDEYLTSFGNAITITGGSDDQFTRIVRVLGQMSSTGKVLGQDMNQLAQNLPGYNVWQALADGAGTSVQELRRLQDLGQLDELLTGDEAVRILVEGMETIPGAVGAMERRMNTLGGALEKFRETAQLAISDGLQPFSETAQDILKDPVILNSVEDLADGFGDLLSSGLKEIAPELDDLAAAGATFLKALGDWAPAFGSIVDALGDFLNFAAPFVSALGKMTSSVLDFGGGLGKLGLAAGALAIGGPFGIGAGVLLGVSGAMDLLGGNAEETANLVRLLAAAQDEVNVSMMAGEEVVLSESQRLAVQTAEQMLTLYPELAAAMQRHGVTVRELRESTIAYATGVGEVLPEVQALWDDTQPTEDPSEWFNVTELRSDLADYEDALKGASGTVEESYQKGVAALEIAGIEDEALIEERRQAHAKYVDDITSYYEDLGWSYAEQVDYWGQLDEERTDALTELLKDQVSAYEEWEADINSSTDGAGISLSGVAEEAENSARRMIDAINQNSSDTFAWKDNIVLAAQNVQDSLGLTDTEAQEFMGTLGEMGLAAAPALQEMVDDFKGKGTLLEDFYTSNAVNAATMSRSLTDEFDAATGSPADLAEAISEGSLTIEEVLAEIPAAMAAAGIDLETAAGQIDIADDLGLVGGAGVEGLVNALSSAAALARVRRASRTLAYASINAVERSFDTGSPSRVMYDIGEFVVEGLVGGMQSMSNEAYATAAQTASLISGGIEDHFRDAEKPQEEARKFAEDVAKAIIDELIAEQEAVADAAVALAEAAADALSDAWEKVKDRFKTRDIQEAIADAQAELSSSRAELASAESLAGATGTAAIAAAQSRVAQAEAALAAAEATDVAADLIADQTLTAFRRATEDTVEALSKQQEAETTAIQARTDAETTAIQARIDAAKRNLDPVARAAAEADLAATKERHEADLAATEERHEAEMTALERQREDEEDLLRLRLDNENEVREAAIKAKEDEAKSFEKALDGVVASVKDAIADLADLRGDVSDAERDLQEAFFDQFEKLLENVSTVDASLLRSVGASAGLSTAEVSDLINAAAASESANQGAAAANLGVDQLIDLLSTGLYTLGADGALGIAAGLSDGARAIAEAMYSSLQYAIKATLSNLEIRSPSRVTGRLIGEPMAEGIAKGILSGQGVVSSAMNGLIDNVIGGVSLPSASQLVDGSGNGNASVASMYSGPLVTMPGAVIQDATDADLVAQRVLVALSAVGVEA